MLKTVKNLLHAKFMFSTQHVACNLAEELKCDLYHFFTWLDSQIKMLLLCRNLHWLCLERKKQNESSVMFLKGEHYPPQQDVLHVEITTSCFIHSLNSLSINRLICIINIFMHRSGSVPKVNNNFILCFVTKYHLCVNSNYDETKLL